MARRSPRALVQVNLRMREAERRRLAEAAERNRTSLNAEMMARLDRSFEQRQLLQLDQISENVHRHLLPLLENVHELNKSGDYHRAVEKLIQRVEPLLARIDEPGEVKAVQEAIADIARVQRMIEIEAGTRLRRMKTTGAQP